MELDFIWNKDYNDLGFWEYHLYVNGEMIGSVIPEYKGKKKRWKVQYKNRNPYYRDSLKIGKRELQWTHTQYSNNNIAIIS